MCIHLLRDDDIADMATPGVLPTYQLYINGVPLPKSRRTFRLREKYILLLVFFTFGTVCFGAFFFLPDLSFSDHARFQDVFMPQPGDDDGGKNIPFRHSPLEDNDGHREQDRDRLNSKIEEQKIRDAVLKRLNISEHERENLQKEIQKDKDKVLDEKKKAEVEQRSKEESIKVDHVEPGVNETRRRKEKVKEMMKFAWDSYVKYAWGQNELRPISRRGHSASIFGNTQFGASIVDGLDTLYIMGLMDEYKKGRDWVQSSLTFEGATDISVFEVNIRFVGGLLACYALSGDEMFKNKAVAVADKLLPAFNTPTGIPFAMVNLRSGNGRNWGWASGGCSILAEYGTLHLEFAYLTEITGNQVYMDKIKRIMEVLGQLEKPNGLYPNYLNPRTGRWGQIHVSIGALGDSFYEYLLKYWLMTGKKDTEYRRLFDNAVEGLEKNLLQKSRSGLSYFGEYKSGRIEHKMDHLACFSGGMFALGAEGSKDKAKFMKIAEDITHTCHQAYDRSATKLGPEAFRFDGNVEAKAVRQNEKYYILRPEVIESYFYLWRFTKNPKYRDWGWEAVQALERWCRTDGGYTGIRDVYQTNPPKDDVQQSFFFAETLKYLYLLFSDDDLISIDKWVFNSEAHPLPIKGTNIPHAGS